MASDIRHSASVARPSLLSGNDPPAVHLINPAGASPFVLVGDHAGRLVPASLGTLGIGAADAERHIAWDIGVQALGERLAAELDAPFVCQRYSRLVIDCNRAPDRADAIPAISDGTVVPANAALTDADRAARVAAIHAPYQAAIGELITTRDAAGMATTMVALHSFTPAMANGAPRPWQIGILHDAGDPAFAGACLAALRARGDLVVGDNEPYRMDTIDYTIPRHAYPARRRYVEIEIRQDLLADQAVHWAEIVAAMLAAAS